MPMRRRFKPTEREVFVPQTEVEWLNGTTWRPGKVITSIQVDSLGRQYVVVVNQGATRTISDGQLVSGYPGHIRLRDAEAAPGTLGPATSALEPQAAAHEAETIPEQCGLF